VQAHFIDKRQPKECRLLVVSLLMVTNETAKAIDAMGRDAVISQPTAMILWPE
jgi:hypothetical protein